MPCNHETVRCTDNVFYCCTCGAVLDVTQIPVQEEKSVEEAQKPPKRNARKGGKANA